MKNAFGSVKLNIELILSDWNYERSEFIVLNMTKVILTISKLNPNMPSLGIIRQKSNNPPPIIM